MANANKPHIQRGQYPHIWTITSPSGNVVFSCNGLWRAVRIALDMMPWAGWAVEDFNG